MPDYLRMLRQVKHYTDLGLNARMLTGPPSNERKRARALLTKYHRFLCGYSKGDDIRRGYLGRGDKVYRPRRGSRNALRAAQATGATGFPRLTAFVFDAPEGTRIRWTSSGVTYRVDNPRRTETRREILFDRSRIPVPYTAEGWLDFDGYYFDTLMPYPDTVEGGKRYWRALFAQGENRAIAFEGPGSKGRLLDYLENSIAKANYQNLDGRDGADVILRGVVFTDVPDTSQRTFAEIREARQEAIRSRRARRRALCD